MAKVSITCKNCDCVFQKDVKAFNLSEKRKHNHFCSKKCAGTFSRKRAELKCSVCGTPVSRPLSAVRSLMVFCSKKCSNSRSNTLRSGKNHPLWVNGYSAYRKKALEYYPKECAICGYAIIEVLEVHHIDGNRKNNRLDNLTVVCPTHHKEYDLGLR